MLLAAVRLK